MDEDLARLRRALDEHLELHGRWSPSVPETTRDTVRIEVLESLGVDLRRLREFEAAHLDY